MTQAQIERYEQLRPARQELVDALDCFKEGAQVEFCVAVERTGPTALMEIYNYKHIKDAGAVARFKIFLQCLLDDINEQMSEI